MAELPALKQLHRGARLVPEQYFTLKCTSALSAAQVDHRQAPGVPCGEDTPRRGVCCILAAYDSVVVVRLCKK